MDAVFISTSCLSQVFGTLHRPLCLRSEDADPLSETLHICVLPALLIVRGQRRRRWYKVSRVRQSIFMGKHLPATVITFVGDVTPTKFSLQLSQVQPCLIVLRKKRNNSLDQVSMCQENYN